MISRGCTGLVAWEGGRGGDCQVVVGGCAGGNASGGGEYWGGGG